MQKIRLIASRNRILRIWHLVVLLLCALMVSITGCEKPARQDAAQVSKSGTIFATQLVEYYGSLADDAQRTWELTAFDDAYQQERIVQLARSQGTSLPAGAASSATTDAIAIQYQTEYQAILARKNLAERFVGLYAAFTHLTDYDASAEIVKSANDLSQATGELARYPMPTIGGNSSSIAGGVLTDLVAQAGVIAQNKDLAKSNQAIIAALNDLQKIYASEHSVYDGIAQGRATAETSLAQDLVQGDTVASAGLFNDILSTYSLTWNTQNTTQDQTVKSGIKALIAARANRVLMLSRSASTTEANALANLITLHNQLQTNKPLSVADFVETSSTARILLQQLKAGNTQEDLASFIRTITGGSK